MRFCPFRKRPWMTDRTFGPIRISFGRRRIKVAVSHFLFAGVKGHHALKNLLSKFELPERIGVGFVFLRCSYAEL